MFPAKGLPNKQCDKDSNISNTADQEENGVDTNTDTDSDYSWELGFWDDYESSNSRPLSPVDDVDEVVAGQEKNQEDKGKQEERNEEDGKKAESEGEKSNVKDKNKEDE